MQRYPVHYFDDKKNQKKFLDEFAMKYNLTCPGDWSRITLTMMKQRGGQVCVKSCYKLTLKGLLARHNNSLYSALSSVYSQVDWRNIRERDAPTQTSAEHGKFFQQLTKFLS